jgi:hypothetical protein
MTSSNAGKNTLDREFILFAVQQKRQQVAVATPQQADKLKIEIRLLLQRGGFDGESRCQ